jgi:hypothetical protein
MSKYISVRKSSRLTEKFEKGSCTWWKFESVAFHLTVRLLNSALKIVVSPLRYLHFRLQQMPQKYIYTFTYNLAFSSRGIRNRNRVRCTVPASDCC